MNDRDIEFDVTNDPLPFVLKGQKRIINGFMKLNNLTKGVPKMDSFLFRKYDHEIVPLLLPRILTLSKKIGSIVSFSGCKRKRVFSL